MTTEQLKQSAAAMDAFADGKRIQIQYNGVGEWDDWRIDMPDCWHKHPFRPKPEPKKRDWSKPEDVPLNCWLKDGTNERLIVHIDPSGVICGHAGTTYLFSCDDFKNIHYSTDRKTWHKCEVEE